MVTFIFSTRTGLLSALIRRLTRARVSHAAIGTSLHDVEVVIESTGRGVIVTPRRRWVRQNRLISEFRVPNDVDIAAAVKRLGAAYDFGGLLGFLLVLIASWFKRKIRNPWASPRALVCSELLVRALPKGHGLDPEQTSPHVLERHCLLNVAFVPVRPP